MRTPTLELHFRPTVSSFISTAATGAAREVAAFGTRGDGKTWGAAGVMIAHGQAHHAAGYALPTQWLGVADTFQSHKQKTVKSLQAPGWRGAWSLRDDGHLAVFRVQGAELVHLTLFGVEDHAGMDRLRAECHGLWFEEPAPASVLVQSSGLSEAAWGLGMTSQRLPSHAHPAIMTLNYPDEDHWTWQRFVVRRHPGTAFVRIPPGELASAEDRAEWARALEGRPDLLRRLLAGEPGVIALGPSVAVGWNPLTHVAAAPLKVEEHAELWFGHDSAPNALHHATVIGQRIKGQVRVFAGLVSERTGLKQHLEATVLPWLSRRAPWALEEIGHERVFGRYDPVMDTEEGGDVDHNPIGRVRREIRGSYRPGPVSWAGRSGPMLTLFNLGDGQGGQALQVDPTPDTELLRKALGGRWYYGMDARGVVNRDLPHKPNHPWEDLGDGFCYFAGGIAPSRERDLRPRPTHARTAFDPFSYHRERDRTVKGSLS